MKIMITVCCLGILITVLSAQNVYLNEIRANDAGTDDSEFIELIGPAGVDISGWTVNHFNGSGASLLFSFTFPVGTVFPDDGVTDRSGSPIGFIVVRNNTHTVPNSDYDWGNIGLQNGPDGLELLNESGQRIQALTWNGLGDLGGGIPAWRNIGNDPNSDNSLSAPDSVQENFAKTWSAENATPGALNTGQVSGDISLPVQLSGFRAVGGDKIVTLFWRTASEIDHLGFLIERSNTEKGVYRQIASYKTDENLLGIGNSSQERRYVYSDQSVLNGIVYWYRLVDVDIDGVHTVHHPVSATPNSGVHQIDVPDEGGKPESFNLFQNYPNPFNPATRISFDVPRISQGFINVSLSVYDISGRKIRTLVDAPLAAGYYHAEWDGCNRYGKKVSSGLYFYELASNKFYAVRRMLLVR